MQVRKLKKTTVKYSWELSFKGKDMYITYYRNGKELAGPFSIEESGLSEEVQGRKSEFLKATEGERRETKRLHDTTSMDHEKDFYDKRFKELSDDFEGIKGMIVP